MEVSCFEKQPEVMLFCSSSTAVIRIPVPCSMQSLWTVAAQLCVKRQSNVFPFSLKKNKGVTKFAIVDLRVEKACKEFNRKM